MTALLEIYCNNLFRNSEKICRPKAQPDEDTFTNGVLLITQLLGIMKSRKPVNHTSWMVAFTPANRPKTVRNHYVIGVFGGNILLPLSFLEFSVGKGFFLSQNRVRPLSCSYNGTYIRYITTESFSMFKGLSNEI